MTLSLLWYIIMIRFNLVGRVFDNLTVESESSPRISNAGIKTYKWLCQCICGNKVIVSSQKLLSKTRPTVSCGCKHYTRLHGNRKHLDPKISSWNALIKRYRMSSKNKKIKWDLTDDQALSLFNNNCFYCGIIPTNEYNVYITKRGKYMTRNKDWANKAGIVFNGIDRKNSDLGYDINNTCSCCSTCNYAKSDLSIDEFFNWVSRISKEFYKKNENCCNI